MFLSLLASVIVRHGAIMVSNNLPVTAEQLRNFESLCSNGRKAGIVVIDVDKDEWPDRFELSELIRKSGFENTAHARFEKAEPKQLKFLEELISGSQAVIVAGHDEPSILRVFGRDWCQQIFGKFIERGGTWFGIGPGAKVLGDRMLVGDKTQPGLSLFDGIITTDYYAKHNEIPLRNAYFGSRLQLGIGLNRDEWMIFRDGLIEKKVGTPQVFLRE
jgi:hypothetical protein